MEASNEKNKKERKQQQNQCDVQKKKSRREKTGKKCEIEMKNFVFLSLCNLIFFFFILVIHWSDAIGLENWVIYGLHIVWMGAEFIKHKEWKKETKGK